MNTDLIITILGALLAVSEALSFIPGIKANGIFQLIVGGIGKAYELIAKKKPPLP